MAPARASQEWCQNTTMKRKAAKDRCKAKTAKGTRCKRRAVKGGRCHIPGHAVGADSAPRDRVRRPQNRDKALAAAYLRLLGGTLDQSADGAGCARRQIVEWETCSWWPELQAEARQRWLRDGDARTMRGLLKALGDPREYAQAAKWWADRRIPELKPPKLQTELTGKDGEKFEQVIKIGSLEVKF